ncbi:polysaccharide deacetylase family protein [Halostella sp. PRR32]|uniref:polysaccharide deacetylase family protein n=1 Tax=Halostella sp. PRR32 TaxID=3098147 RepID=UPI002B1D1427|nr:polysaccharide deacetylase family protein [Halostella sp. PRR32]
MTERSRRAFLGTLGTTVCGTLLAREGFKRLRSAGESGPQDADPPAVPPDSLRVRSSSRSIAARRGTLHAGLNSAESWEPVAGSLSPERDSPREGSEPMRLASNSAGKRLGSDSAGAIEYTFDTPFDFTESGLSFWAKFLGRPTAPLRIRLFAPDERNQLLATRYTANSMSNAWFGIDVGPTTEVGSPDPANVSRIQIEVDARDRPLLLDRFETKPAARTGRVMLIFDDNRASVASAYEEMHRRGLTGAIAVIPDLVGDRGHLSADQLATYHADGWDLVSHPQLDKPLPAYSEATQRREIIRTKRWLVSHGYEAGADHFVAPFGKIGPKTLELLEEFHHTNYLTTNGLNDTPPTDPLTIDRVAIDDVQNAKRQIELAATYDRLAVLSAHTVGNADDRWVSRDGFIDVLDHIERSAVEVVTPTSYWETAAAVSGSD